MASNHLTNGTNNKHVHAKKKIIPKNDKQPKLPVCRYRDAFLKLLDDNQTLVIVGETGSGKTTQIPKWCLDFCRKKVGKQLSVACTQPRRIAAMSIAARVAKEMNVQLGQEVGYSVRFDTKSTQKTVLKYLTDGMLLREAMLDDLLSSYGVIILDEAHERTLQTEILFGVIKRALNLRNKNQTSMPPLKVVAMSATINVKLFKRYLSAPVLSIEGRQHPVQDMFAEVSQSDLLTSTLITVFQIHRNHIDGDILVFCSGQDQIQSLVFLCKQVLKQAPESLQDLTPLPLYASLPARHQMKVFETSKPNSKSSISSETQTTPHRRVIFSTNVAETSVTIPNIKFVIDTGKVKCRSYCPKTGLESLNVTNISKAQANQRSGRAGRVCPGTCYRLYTSEEHAQMVDHQLPEIKRCSLDSVILQMISIGINNIHSFEFLERPEDARIKSAIANLLSLKAIKPSTLKDKLSGDCPSTSHEMSTNHHNKNNNRDSKEDNLLNLNYELTGIGKKLSIFPLSPSMSRILLAASELGCLDEALTVVSLLFIENLFYIQPNRQNQADTMLEKFRSNEGDAIMLLKAFRAFKRTSLVNKAGLKQWCREHFIHGKNLRMARLVRKQLLILCRNQGMQSSSCGQDTSIVRRALTYGLFNNVATMWNGKYRNKFSDDIHIHPSSCLFRTKPECILYVDILETNKCYMRNCTLIDMSWVREISSSNISSSISSK